MRFPSSRFPRTYVRGGGGDMPRGMACTWHVTRGPIRAAEKENRGRSSFPWRSIAGRPPWEVVGRGFRGLRQKGCQRRTIGRRAAGNRELKEQPAVAGYRAVLPEAVPNLNRVVRQGCLDLPGLSVRHGVPDLGLWTLNSRLSTMMRFCPGGFKIKKCATRTDGICGQSGHRGTICASVQHELTEESRPVGEAA